MQPSPLKDKLFNKSHFLTLYIQVDAHFKDFIVSSSHFKMSKYTFSSSKDLKITKNGDFLVSAVTTKTGKPFVIPLFYLWDFSFLVDIGNFHSQ